MWTTLADGSLRGGIPVLPSRGRTVAQLVVAALVVFGLVLVGTSYAAIRLAEREAVNDAAHTANLLAQALVQPALTDALVGGDAAAYAAFDRIVRESVLPNGIVRVKLWTADGTIVYADERRLVGQRFPLAEDQLEVLTNPQTRAEVSELDRSENEFERYGGKLLEVYRPVWTPSGKPLLFEVYGAYAPVAERTNDLWRGLAGLLASSLLLLLVLMTPILWKVIGRLGQAHAHRELLLRRAVDASEEERRRIAATLHDGPVQDLVASSLAVAGAAEQASTAGHPELAADIREAGVTVRSSVAGLRSLLVDLYPDRLADAGLAAAVEDLAGPLRSRGTPVTLALAPEAVAALDEDAARLVYRVTRECLRNVVKHAGSCAVQVRLSTEASGRHTELLVADDGVGFDVAASRRRHGHFGLRVLTDLAEAAGAVLQVASAPGAGTRWRMLVPHSPGGMP